MELPRCKRVVWCPLQFGAWISTGNKILINDQVQDMTRKVWLCLQMTYKQWRTQKVSKGLPWFRHNRVTSQINFIWSAEGTTILGWSAGMAWEN